MTLHTFDIVEGVAVTPTLARPAGPRKVPLSEQIMNTFHQYKASWRAGSDLTLLETRLLAIARNVFDLESGRDTSVPKAYQ